ncbi:MAG: roadblock/LC7 domain-containing protein [Polyangiaceae bacterium]|jgi:predicted regulator of Ras-like GTPase activity (Roadblock/LC7/MglB family)
MKEFSAIAKLPDVLGAVLSDHSGALLDWSGSVDGETAGAVHAFTVRAFTQAGDLLGVGAFQRVSIVGPTKACVVTLHGDTILGTYTDPTKPIASVEKRLQDTLPK